MLLAGQAVSPESSAALERLCRAYWLPICVFARRKGWNEEDAKDLTQQFFARLLERNDFHGLNPSKGKFRTFLLTAFTHFLANEHDRATALKRGGGQKIISLDQFSPDELGDAATDARFTPATAYDQRWAQTVLQSALRALKNEMTAAGKQAQFDTLKPFLTASAGGGEYAVARRKARRGRRIGPRDGASPAPAFSGNGARRSGGNGFHPERARRGNAAFVPKR